MIEHVAIWTRNLEMMTAFYVRYFGGTAGSLYESRKEDGTLRTVFISFGSGARLELMSFDTVKASDAPYPAEGLAHIAFGVDDRAAVDALAQRLRSDGYDILSPPRITGDGYYEACASDPDGNRVEIVAAGMAESRG